ncbi:MAG TPA: ABC transporter ATP-binding protein [Symbiobacteriaceae bacterium]|nr:ABC transporter ATP-binding protein [Symbiobacteriaceae bacterium]
MIQSLRTAGLPSAHQQQFLLTFQSVSYRYQQADQSVPAVENLTLTIPIGSFVAVVGPSGCGKSTLLHMASGIMPPSAGQVILHGKPLQGLASNVGYVLQQDGLLPWKTVAQNVGLALTLKGLKPDQIQDEVADWLKRTDLSRFAQSYPSQLSGGMRKRAALAASLINHPELLLMDEPLSALDVQTRILIGNELLTLWQRDRNTVLLVTHDLEEAIGMADYVVVLTARPARVRAVYPIDLPRPRDLSLIRLTPEFQDLYSAIWTDLREEVLRAHVHHP